MGKATNTPQTAQVSEQTPTPIQFKNTTVGKTIRTGLQAFAGAMVTAIPVLIASEDFRKYLVDHPEYAWIALLLPVAVSFFTFLQNYADPTVPNTVNSAV